MRDVCGPILCRPVFRLCLTFFVSILISYFHHTPSDCFVIPINLSYPAHSLRSKTWYGLRSCETLPVHRPWKRPKQWEPFMYTKCAKNLAFFDWMESNDESDHLDWESVRVITHTTSSFECLWVEGGSIVYFEYYQKTFRVHHETDAD